jgi:hypothetical protein
VRKMQKTETENVQHVNTKNNRPQLKGKCVVCGTTKTQFVKMKQGGDLVGTLNSVMSNVKLPGQMFEGEMHLNGSNFIAPGTRLDKPDGITPKPFSIPVDRVVKAAYHHDIAYNNFKDTKTRNHFDRILLKELDAIDNPTPREQFEIAVVKPIINSKQRFGLGIDGVLKKPRNQRKQCVGVIN